MSPLITSSDPVPQPDIKCNKTEKTNNSCHLVLSCVTPGQSLNYTWYSDSGRLPEEFQGAVLNITVKPQNYSSFYTCRVSNPVSDKNDTVYFTPPCQIGKKCPSGRMVSGFPRMKKGVGTLFSPPAQNWAENHNGTWKTWVLLFVALPSPPRSSPHLCGT